MEGFEGLTRLEKDNVLRMLDGCIARICVSDDPSEVVRLLGFANYYLAQLALNNFVRISKLEVNK